MGVDEWAWSKGQSFGTILLIVDAQRRKALFTGDHGMLAHARISYEDPAKHKYQYLVTFACERERGNFRLEKSKTEVLGG